MSGTPLAGLALVEAALDQPHPSPRLVRTLNRVLREMRHPARLKSEDSPERREEVGSLAAYMEPV